MILVPSNLENILYIDRYSRYISNEIHKVTLEFSKHAVKRGSPVVRFHNWDGIMGSHPL